MIHCTESHLRLRIVPLEAAFQAFICFNVAAFQAFICLHMVTDVLANRNACAALKKALKREVTDETADVWSHVTHVNSYSRIEYASRQKAQSCGEGHGNRR